MLLVDTSVWIATFRNRNPIDLESVAPLEEIVTCPPIVQELLQGWTSEAALRVAREAILAFPIVESPMRLEVFEHAAELYRSARRSGFTVRSSIDCIIAACAIRNDLEVVHWDRDYKILARISGLRQRCV